MSLNNALRVRGLALGLAIHAVGWGVGCLLGYLVWDDPFYTWVDVADPPLALFAIGHVVLAALASYKLARLVGDRTDELHLDGVWVGVLAPALVWPYLFLHGWEGIDVWREMDVSWLWFAGWQAAGVAVGLTVKKIKVL